MSLTKTDLKLINGLIETNTKKLMLWISDNFLTKDEAVSKYYLEEKLTPINDKIAALQDAVANIDAKFTVSIAMTDSKIFRLEERLNKLETT